MSDLTNFEIQLNINEKLKNIVDSYYKQLGYPILKQNIIKKLRQNLTIEELYVFDTEADESYIYSGIRTITSFITGSTNNPCEWLWITLQQKELIEEYIKNAYKELYLSESVKSFDASKDDVIIIYGFDSESYDYDQYNHRLVKNTLLNKLLYYYGSVIGWVFFSIFALLLIQISK